MNNKQAIKLVQQQIEEAKRWQHLLRGQQSSERVIHAMGIILELAKKQVEELEE